MHVPALLAWYRAHRRRMPWREEVSPYRTLVSELMLQQTRVETVIPYFHRFMETFPTVEALAAADEERVLERWSGLGYYSRARNLHRAARAVVAVGGFPADHGGLLSLPGVGPYTAGAIGSIALGLDLPVVDGNVERVLSRQLAEPAMGKRRPWEVMTALLPPGEAGDFNQAVMELGATICTPRSPRCLLCPVRPTCRGVDEPERFPAPKERKEVPRAHAHHAVLRRDGCILLSRRPPTGLLGGLWELPGGEGELRDALGRIGLDLRGASVLGEVVHRFTHLHLTVTVHDAVADGEVYLRPDLRWVPVGEVDGMALSTLARKTLAVAGQRERRA